MNLHYVFTHIIQEHFTDTGATMLTPGQSYSCPSPNEMILKDMDKLAVTKL